MTLATQDVKLEIFEGPLDLLLHLIRKNDLNIYDIPISQITSEYLAYLDLIKEMNLEMAGEFLVMASTLMQIKARTLLPAPETAGDEGPDPRAELVNRLLEYQRYKEAAKELSKSMEAHKEIYYRGAPLFSDEDYALGTTLFDLMDAFRDVLQELKPNVREILYEEIPMEVKIREILSYIEDKDFVTFREILRLSTTRHGLVVTFLAMLELIRLKQVVARQVQNFGEIRVYRAEEGKEIPPVIEDMTAAAQLAPAPASDPFKIPAAESFAPAVVSKTLEEDASAGPNQNIVDEPIAEAAGKEDIKTGEDLSPPSQGGAQGRSDLSDNQPPENILVPDSPTESPLLLGGRPLDTPASASEGEGEGQESSRDTQEK